MAADGAADADRARRQLEELRDALNKQIARLLQRLDTERGADRLQADRQALATASTVRRQVVDAIDGIGPIVRDITEEAAANAADRVARSVDLGDFTPDQTSAIQQIINGQIDEVAGLLRDGQAEIAQAIRLGVNTSAPMGDVIDEVARVLDTSFAKAQAAVDSAIMGAGRYTTMAAVEQANALPGGPVLGFRLVGPSDGKTRPWCRDMMDRTASRPITQDELDGMLNDQGLDAAVFAGGYNCRHSWAPAPMEE